MRLARVVSVVLFGYALSAPAFALEVLSPSPQTVVPAGSVVTVTVGPSAGETLQNAFVGTSDEIVQGAAGPQPGTFVLQVRVPKDAVGPTFMLAAADVADGLSTAVVRFIADPGPLQELIVTASPVLGGIGEVRRVRVRGVFADGVTRELSAGQTGTTYTTTNGAVLGVDPSGLMQARARGTAQIVVTNRHVVSGVTVTSGVTVRCDLPSPPTNRIPTADAGADQTVATETVVRLDGAASADPDGDAITYRWEQLSGRTVILGDPDTAAPFFMSPRVSTADVLEFGLVVTDSKGATTLPKIVRVTVQP